MLIRLPTKISLIGVNKWIAISKFFEFKYFQKTLVKQIEFPLSDVGSGFFMQGIKAFYSALYFQNLAECWWTGF